jgi:hypothetical protein
MPADLCWNKFILRRIVGRIWIGSIQLALQRIRTRVRNGGHDVPGGTPKMIAFEESGNREVLDPEGYTGKGSRVKSLFLTVAYLSERNRASGTLITMFTNRFAAGFGDDIV